MTNGKDYEHVKSDEFAAVCGSCEMCADSTAPSITLTEHPWDPRCLTGVVSHKMALTVAHDVGLIEAEWRKFKDIEPPLDREIAFKVALRGYAEEMIMAAHNGR